MDFYERWGLYRVPERSDIIFSRHYEDRRRARSGKNGFKTKDIYHKIRHLILTGKVKMGKIIEGEKSYYVMDTKKRRHYFMLLDDKILMTTVYIPDGYIELFQIQRFMDRLFLNLILTLK